MPNCRKAIDDFYKTAILGKSHKPTTMGRAGSPKILNMCLEGEKRLAWKQSGIDRVSLWLHFLYNENNC